MKIEKIAVGVVIAGAAIYLILKIRESKATFGGWEAGGPSSSYAPISTGVPPWPFQPPAGMTFIWNGSMWILEPSAIGDAYMGQ